MLKLCVYLEPRANEAFAIFVGQISPDALPPLGWLGLISDMLTRVWANFMYLHEYSFFVCLHFL